LLTERYSFLTTREAESRRQTLSAHEQLALRDADYRNLLANYESQESTKKSGVSGRFPCHGYRRLHRSEVRIPPTECAFPILVEHLRPHLQE
jgi:hypothetical protein